MALTEAKKTKIRAAIKTIGESLTEITDILLNGAPETPVQPQKRKKDPNAPKHPPSSYFLYMLSIKDEVERENPESTFSEKSKIYGAKWQKLSDKEKQVFVDKAKVEKEKYLKELAAYTKSQEGEFNESANNKKVKKEATEVKKEKKTETPVIVQTSEAESSDSDSSDSDSDSSSSSSSSDSSATSSDSDSD